MSSHADSVRPECQWPQSYPLSPFPITYPNQKLRPTALSVTNRQCSAALFCQTRICGIVHIVRGPAFVFQFFVHVALAGYAIVMSWLTNEPGVDRGLRFYAFHPSYFNTPNSSSPSPAEPTRGQPNTPNYRVFHGLRRLLGSRDVYSIYVITLPESYWVG